MFRFFLATAVTAGRSDVVEAFLRQIAGRLPPGEDWLQWYGIGVTSGKPSENPQLHEFFTEAPCEKQPATNLSALDKL